MVVDMVIYLSKTSFEAALLRIKISAAFISRLSQRIGKSFYRTIFPKFMKQNIEQIIEEHKKKKILKKQAMTNPRIIQTSTNVMQPTPPKNPNWNLNNTNPMSTEVPKQHKFRFWKRIPKNTMEPKPSMHQKLNSVKMNPHFIHNSGNNMESKSNKKRFWNRKLKKTEETKTHKDQNLTAFETNPQHKENMESIHNENSIWSPWKPVETNPHFLKQS